MDYQRKEFEHWFSNEGKWPQAVERNGDGYKLIGAQEAWATWKAARPIGWALVPVRPTPEMISAAEDGYMPFGDMGFAIQCAIANSSHPENETPI